MATGKPDLLSRAKKAAAPAQAKPKKADGMREVLVPEALRPQFIEFVELGFINKGLEDVCKSHRSDMVDAFLHIWVHEMWETRRRPDNFKAVVPRGTGPSVDCSCNFVIEVRKDGIQKKVPAPHEIPEGKTFEEIVMGTLRKLGISESNAKKFVQEELVIVQALDFKESLDVMYAYDNGTPQKSAVEKILTYMQLRAKSGLAKLPLFTDDEEAVCLVTKQTVTLKDGLPDRLFTYCESEEQLMALLKWINPTPKLYMFSVGEGDEKRATEDRLAKTTVRFLFAAEAA